MSDLRMLCADRPEPLGEIFAPNSWYGFAAILKRYAAWRWPLPMVVPHGVYLARSLWSAEVEAPLPAVYAYPDYRSEVYRGAGRRWRVVDGCSPWIYLLALHGPLRDDARGILAFPPHSTHFVSADMADAAFADYLRERAGSDEPVSVCLYWRDVQLGRDAPYRAAGLPVVSAGHMFDEAFSARQLALLDSHARVVTPGLGSHVMYAAAAGRPVELVEDFDLRRSGAAVALARDVAVPESDVMDEVNAAFTPDIDLARQRRCAERFLGAAALRSPQALRDLFRELARSPQWWGAGTLRLALRRARRTVAELRRPAPEAI